MTSNATDLRRMMPYSKRLATLLATVVCLEAKATDDALELFDVIMTSELLARAERQPNADKLSRYARLGKDAHRLASAVSVLLEAQEWDATITIDVLWDAIENVASHAELRVSVANIHQILPPDADPAGEWRSALMSRYPLTRKFLRLLAETVEFGATTDAALVTSFMPCRQGRTWRPTSTLRNPASPGPSCSPRCASSAATFRQTPGASPTTSRQA
jgi:hypothetical protein